ncbi:hypothetical protein DR950_17845 [Kitasatospora xanthocidica]|uniref:Minor tail protein n=1 Tax=Kitasatospora xanthocidica TaxID=83382 RepID=A0A372ZVR8_9ACTN|nr:hypothetical protein [Kitasatospora xanthocidica]RGD59407.1 hypothetical protein DR950_17845 [Kitasatospora xanthocidica]
MPTALDALATRIATLETALLELSRSSRLSHSSIDDGALTVTSGGRLRAIIGQQPDGTTGITAVNGPVPPAPRAPTAAAALGGVRVTWNGGFADGAVSPLDLAHVEVHASTTALFVPSPTTVVTTIATPQGSTVTVPTTVPVWVALVARTTSGKASKPSGTATAGPAPVVAQEVLAGIVGELQLADDAVTAAKLGEAAVVAGKLAVDAVTAKSLAADSVVAGKLAADSVTGRELKAMSVTADKLAANSITADKLAAGAITAAALSADAIDGRTIKGVTITGGTVTGGTLQTGTTGRRVVLVPTDPVNGTSAPSTLLYSGASAERAPARLTANVQDTPDGSAPSSTLSSPQVTPDGAHTSRLVLSAGGPDAGYAPQGRATLEAVGGWQSGGASVTTTAGTTSGSAEATVIATARRQDNAKSAIQLLSCSQHIVQLVDQVAATYLDKTGLTVRALAGGMLLQSSTGLRVQGGDIVVTSGVVRAESAAWTTPTFQNGCTSLAGWRPVGLKKRPDGTVMLRGIAAVPAGFGGGVVAVIDDPALRPQIGEVFTVSAANPAVATLFLQPNGNLEVWNPTGSFGGWISFSGVEWSSID